MDLNAIINPVWNTLSDKLWKSYFEKIKSYYTGTTLNLTNCTGDNLLNLTIGGNSEQIPEHNVRSVEGTAVRVDDAFGGSIKNITQYGQCDISGTPSTETPATITGRVAGGTVYGKNLIPYPYSNTTKTLNGITFTDNNGIITVNGTATSDAKFTIASGLTIKSSSMLSGCPIGGSTSTYYMYNEQYSYKDTGNGIYQIAKTNNSYYFIMIKSGTVCNNLVFKPQITIGNTISEYTPYKTPISYTVTDANGQPVTLYGIPVTSGGNVTIDGQQYVADYISNGVGHRKIGMCAFYGNEQIVYSAGAFTCQNKGSANIRNNSISTHFVYKFAYSDGTDHILLSDAWYFYKQDCTTVEQFKAYLAAQYAAGTPVTVYYVLAEETTFPVTVNAVNAYTPTTTFISDCYTSAELAVTGQGNVTLPTPAWQVPITNTGKLVTEGEHAGKYAVKVKVSGKNLIDFSVSNVKNVQQCEIESVPNGFSIKNSSFAFSNVTFEIPDNLYGKTVTIKYNHIGILSSNQRAMGIMFSGTNAFNASTGYKDVPPNSSYTVTLPTKENNEYLKNGKNLLLVCYAPMNDDNNPAIYTNIQVELGTTATAYEPYHEPVTTTIYLDAPLRKGDTLEVVGGKLIQRRAVKVFDGTENWYEFDNSYALGNWAEKKEKQHRMCKQQYICNYFQEDDTYRVEGTFVTNYTTSSWIIINPSKEVYTTVDSFKAFLAAQYTAGTPLTIEYDLATPVEIDISGQDIPTFEGTTIVTVEDVDSQPESLTATYWQEA